MNNVFRTAMIVALLLVASVTSSLAVCWGDLDNDRDADGSDVAKLIADFGRTDCATHPPCRGDIAPEGSPDDAVDRSDLTLFAADFGRDDCAFHAPLNLFSIGDSIGEGITAYGDPDLAAHHETVWSTGYDSGDTVYSLNERFADTDPTGFYANTEPRDGIFNHAVEGDEMLNFYDQAMAVVGAASAAPSGTVGMITVLLGNNDVCTDTVGTMTDLVDFEDRYRAGLEALKNNDVTKNAYIHVSGIPAIYWLWIAKRSNLWCRLLAWPNVPCQELLANAGVNDCISDEMDPDTIDYDEDGPGPDQGDGPNCIRRKQFHAAIQDDYNRIIRDVLMEFRDDGRLPNAYYADIFDFQFESDHINNFDCFHPSVRGHERMAEEQWCRSPWGADDQACASE